MKTIILVFSFLILSACSETGTENTVLTGLDRVSEYQDLFAGKRIGIITNHTAYNRQDKHILDVFATMPDVQITAIFGPEHGIRGDEAAGTTIENEMDPAKQIPIYSLYGQTRKPTAEMLENVDVLVFDIQDVGARFYTYIYTMSQAMEAAAEQNKIFVVLDRPNPINGIDVEGNLLEAEFATFVGLYPIPVRHGMTVGELAQMFNGEKWLSGGVKANLKVIPMQGWSRDLWFDQTGLKWRGPSPNMPDLHVATVYPGMCLFEGTSVSEGRGTYDPFRRIGAPWLTLEQFEIINKILDLPGVRFGPIQFTPKSIPGMSPKPKFQDENVTGVLVTVVDRQVFRPYYSGIALVKYFHDANPDKFAWRERHFDRLCGTDKIRKMIIENKSLEEIEAFVEKDIPAFIEKRKSYLLY